MPIKFFDSTLRDGSHAIAHQLDPKLIADYCREIDGAGLHTVIVGHGNGLGASSWQVGFASLSDHEMLSIARKELKKTKLGVFLLPGFGTIKYDLEPALKLGVDLVCVASHCTEADVTETYIRYVAAEKKEVYGVLMMYHTTTKERLLEEAKKMQSYGAMGLILMDSAGASTPDMVKEVITYLVNGLDIPVGFHAHENLKMAVANTLIAIQAGATIVDATLRGFGAGSGNCQLEALATLLKKVNIETGLDLYKLMDVSDGIVTKMMKRPQEVDSVSLVSGYAGVFSGFNLPVRRAAEKYGVDARDIFIELGKRKVIGGQEDMVIEVAIELANKKKKI